MYNIEVLLVEVKMFAMVEKKVFFKLSLICISVEDHTSVGHGIIMAILLIC